MKEVKQIKGSCVIYLRKIAGLGKFHGLLADCVLLRLTQILSSKWECTSQHTYIHYYILQSTVENID